MGYELYRHVLQNAPTELDAAARLVLAVIADDANERTRKSYLGMDLLSHRTGLLPDSAGKALRRLAKAGIEIRIPIGTDGKGRPVFAAKGNRTTYLIPVFPERAFMTPKAGREADLSAAQSPDGEQTKDDSKPGRESAKPGSSSAKAGREADPPPQSPQSPHSFSPTNDGSLFPELEDTNTTKDEMPKKKTTAPEHMDITARMRAWADENTPGLNLELETLKFLNYHGAKGSKFIDWVKAWRNWMINALQFAEERQQKQQNHLRVVGGTRSEIPTNEYWDTITDEDLENIL